MLPNDLSHWEARFATHVATLGGDAAHDGEHVRRVVGNARRLAVAEGAPLDVVVPAAWLHDCVHVPKDSPHRADASRLAAEEAARLLAAWGYDATRIADVAHAIEAHSFTAGVPATTAAARVVQDADRLDALGAVGLARTLMLGGAMARPLYDPADPFCEHRAPDDRTSAIDHFYTKLLHLPARPAAVCMRAEAERRVGVLRSFLAALRAELEDA
jgi:uncharacterized protein